MLTFPLPTVQSPGLTRAEIDSLYPQNLLPNNIGLFADTSDYISRTQVGAPTDGSPKYWRDNATIWNPLGPTGQGIFLYVIADGSLILTQDGKTPYIVPNDGFSHPDTWATLGPRLAQFFQQSDVLPHFPVIPKLKIISMAKADAMRMSFAPGVAMAPPIAVLMADETGAITWNGVRYRSTYNTQFVPRFNDANGKAEYFEWSKWAPATGAKLSDSELVLAVQGILGSGMSTAAEAAALRGLLAQA